MLQFSSQNSAKYVRAVLSAVFLPVLMAVFSSVPAWAETDQEIAHLLAFVEDSNCTFIRNDKTYDAAKAREHIERKYNYARRWIKTSEDFIELTATRSSVSGKLYRVRCQDDELPSAQWFQTELTRYRQSQ